MCTQTTPLWCIGYSLGSGLSPSPTDQTEPTDRPPLWFSPYLPLKLRCELMGFENLTRKKMGEKKKCKYCLYIYIYICISHARIRGGRGCHRWGSGHVKCLSSKINEFCLIQSHRQSIQI